MLTTGVFWAVNPGPSWSANPGPGFLCCVVSVSLSRFVSGGGDHDFPIPPGALRSGSPPTLSAHSHLWRAPAPVSRLQSPLALRRGPMPAVGR